MTRHLTLRNRQRTCAVDLRRLRPLVQYLLAELCGATACELGIYLVAKPEMIRLNEQFLRHAGATDVITFNYAEAGPPGVGGELFGDIFICPDVAEEQARRFRTSWPSELVRYIIHGLLHLEGYDDLRAADRRRMKREENRRLRAVARRFPLSALPIAPKLRQ